MLTSVGKLMFFFCMTYQTKLKQDRSVHFVTEIRFRCQDMSGNMFIIKNTNFTEFF